MLKIAVTGSTGLVGSRIIELLKHEIDFIPLPHDKIDLINKDKTWSFLKNINFSILLHLAAYTNVDRAEEEKEKAYSINVEGTKNLLEFVIQKKKKFIYSSTDFVFDGTNPPYFEDSKPNPVTYYGKTKYQGEKIIEKNGMIVRFSFPFRSSHTKKTDFVYKMKSILKEKKPLALVKDSLITPTFIDDIAGSLQHLFNNFSPEIFHVVGSQSLSPYECGKLIAKIFALDELLINPTSLQSFSKKKAKRPQYSDIRSKKNNFFRMKSFEEGLFEINKQLQISNI